MVTWNSFDVTARAGTLIPASPGDFDADGDVDGSDYLKWRRDIGSTFNVAADDNYDGIVDAADYVIWRKHYSEASGSLTAVIATVPEPTTLTLIFLAVTCWSHRRDRKDRAEAV